MKKISQVLKFDIIHNFISIVQNIILFVDKIYISIFDISETRMKN